MGSRNGMCSTPRPHRLGSEAATSMPLASCRLTGVGGQVMECLITLCHPASPPIPSLTSENPPAGKTQYYTYAGHLLQDYYTSVDRDIITLVLRLQAHLPADRPSLDDLDAFVRSRARAKRDNDAPVDAELEKWVNRMLYEPPPEPHEPERRVPVIREVIGGKLAEPITRPRLWDYSRWDGRRDEQRKAMQQKGGITKRFTLPKKRLELPKEHLKLPKTT
ncbi:hypothetical protein F4802DRAFT_569328 [Xylaria palmicola]|nr:hypothetical protein F4802DRAFT_569328 [Xylaria palmicola]